jgi:hypothetical protein
MSAVVNRLENGLEPLKPVEVQHDPGFEVPTETTTKKAAAAFDGEGTYMITIHHG